MAARRIEVVGLVRPRSGQVVSGDTWVVTQAGGTRIAVIDGLGHGPEAARAAEAAAAILRACSDAPVTAALAACHDELRHTRGAAISIAHIHEPADHLTFCGVGNVEGRLAGSPRGHRLSPQRGIVGFALPSLRPVDLPLDGSWRLILHTDGVSGRFSLAPAVDGPQDLSALVQDLVARWGRALDDAAVVVACPAC